MRTLVVAFPLTLSGCLYVHATPGGLVAHGGGTTVVQTPGTTMICDKGEIRYFTPWYDITCCEGRVPEGLLLKLVPYSTVVDGMQMNQGRGQETLIVSTRVTAAAEDVTAYYENALREQGFEVSRSNVETDEGPAIRVHGSARRGQASVSISRPTDDTTLAVEVFVCRDSSL